jgi:hypothetical protein
LHFADRVLIGIQQIDFKSNLHNISNHLMHCITYIYIKVNLSLNPAKMTALAGDKEAYIYNGVT